MDHTAMVRGELSIRPSVVISRLFSPTCARASLKVTPTDYRMVIHRKIGTGIACRSVQKTNLKTPVPRRVAPDDKANLNWGGTRGVPEGRTREGPLYLRVSSIVVIGASKPCPGIGSSLPKLTPSYILCWPLYHSTSMPFQGISVRAAQACKLR